MIKIAQEEIGCHHLLIERQLYTFILLGIEYVPQELLKKIKYKKMTHSIFRIQESVMCGFYCIAFIEYILAEKTL